MERMSWPIWGFVILVLLGQPSPAEEILEPNENFIGKYKNRLTFDDHDFVGAADKHPNAGRSGGIHVAGRAPEIGLGTITEIQNANSVPDTISLIRSAEGSGNTVPL